MGYRKPQHSDAFWDREASKLQLIRPDLVDQIQRGLKYGAVELVIEIAFEYLGFISKIITDASYRARMNTFGPELYEACWRLRHL